MLLRPTAENPNNVLQFRFVDCFITVGLGFVFCGDFFDSRNTSLFRCRFDRRGRFRQPAQLDLALSLVDSRDEKFSAAETPGKRTVTNSFREEGSIRPGGSRTLRQFTRRTPGRRIDWARE